MVFLLACVEPEPEPNPGGSADPSIPALEGSPHEAGWSADEAAAALEEAVARPFPSPFHVRASLDRAFEHGDADCPGLGTLMAGPSFEGCTSTEGWYYLGVGGYTEELFEDDIGEFLELLVRGDLTIVDPDGGTLDIGGHWQVDLREGPAWSAILNGSWHEPGSGEPWLASGASAWLDYAGTGEVGFEHVSLDGALTLGVFDSPITIAFERLELGVGACGETPAGALSVTDPGGGVWRFDFGEDCATCPSVTFDGEAVDTDACPTAAALLLRVIEGSIP